MIRMFQALAVVLIAAAAFFLWRRDLDTAFVTGVLGICAFFLSIRVLFKSRIRERESAKPASQPVAVAEEDDQLE